MNQVGPSDYLVINSRDELLRIPFKSIAYFEADGNYTRIFTVNNLSFIFSIHTLRQQLILSGGERFASTLPISKEAHKELKHLFKSISDNNGTTHRA